MDEFSLAVVIPNYNNAKYLSQCIESVLAQTFKANEIIIVDDCSIDESRTIIRQYEEHFNLVKGVYLESNGGVSNARNVGSLTSSSAYITFLDADDFYYHNDKLKKEMELIKKYAVCGKDVVAYSATVNVNNDGLPKKLPNLAHRRYINGYALVFLIARIKTGTIPRDYCVRREVLAEVGAYSFCKNFYEDLDLLMRLATIVEFHCTFSYGTAYRHNNMGLSRRPQEEHLIAVQEIIAIYYNKLAFSQKGLVKIINAAITPLRLVRRVRNRFRK